jgi:hypothetical protein
MKTISYTLIYQSDFNSQRHVLTRQRAAYLLKAARSRGLSHKPRRQPSGDIVLPNVATLFRKEATVA